jgi:hypothetical protein
MEAEAMTDLSPAALAVMTAGTMGNPNVIGDPVYRQCIAAALRAVADQVVPKDVIWISEDAQVVGQDIREQLLAIAAELEGA